MEKIKNIEISNFKSIKHLKIDGCNKINVFIGQPNAGKSNILEALGLYGMFDLERETISLANFVRQNKLEELFFEENVSENSLIKLNEDTLTISSRDNNLFLHYKNSTDAIKSIIFDYNNHGIDPNSKVEIKKNFINNTRIKKYIFKEYKNNNYINYDVSILDFPYGKNLVQIISSNPELRREVNKLFKNNNLKLLIEKHTNELKIFKEFQDGTVFTLPYELIADTLQRLIFYKAAIMSNKNSVLLFEEPEAHCFEPYILEFTNGVKYDENNNQFFIVTHSDFIIKEFLRDEESKENTNVYLVNNVEGETQVKLLEKDKNEDVYEYGMNVFFNFESLWETN